MQFFAGRVQNKKETKEIEKTIHLGRSGWTSLILNKKHILTTLKTTYR